MSDASSDSSDDGLLDSPVFAKKKRTSRAEKTKLNFMSECLAGSNARTDMHQRIKDVDVEFGVLQQQQQSATDKGIAEHDSNDNGEGKDSDSGKVAGGGETPSTNNDESKQDGSCDAAATTDAITKPTRSSIDTTMTTSTVATTTVRKSDVHQDEDAYWARVDSFATASAGARKRRSDVHSERQKLNDAVSGLVDYNSDMTDDLDEHWDRSNSGGLTREQLRSEAEAICQGAFSNLGLRRMFLQNCAASNNNSKNDSIASINDVDEKKGISQRMANKEEESESRQNQKKQVYTTFNTRQEAMTELKTVVSTLQKEHRTPTTKPDKVLRKFFIDPLVKLLKKPQYIIWDSLNDFLVRNPVLLGRYAIVLPESFCQWMYKLSCSSYSVGKGCSTTCCSLIRKFLLAKMDVYGDSTKEGEGDTNTVSSFGVDMTFLKNFTFDDLISCLVHDFGLWLEPGPIRESNNEEDSENVLDPIDTSDEKEGNDKDDKEASDVGVDVHALKNVFLVWNALFERNLIRLQQDEEKMEEDDETFGKDASRLLAALARVGLDPSFNMANEYETSGEPLPSLMQSLTATLVKSATCQVSEKFDDDKARVDQWLEYTAAAIVKACTNLFAGDKDAADSDDVNGDLVLAMAVKRMVWCEFDNDYSIDLARLNLWFSEKALRACLKDDITDWEGKIKERTEYLCKNLNKDDTSKDAASSGQLHYSIHALVTAEVGLQWIDEETETFMSSHPRFLAAAIIAGECASIGISIYWRAWNDHTSEEECGPVFTATERDTVYEIVSNIEDLCDGLKKECRAVIAYPHLRRAKEYLTRLTKKLQMTKGKPSKIRKKREQGSLDSYFGRPSISMSQQSDPYEDSQES